MAQSNSIPKFDWRSRIVKFDRKPANQFTPHPLNPRKHPLVQREAVGASLGTFGQIAPVIENATNGYLIDGEERIWQALAQGDDTLVDYVLVEMSEEEHEAVLKTYDGTTYLATYDLPTFEALAVNFDMPPALEGWNPEFMATVNLGAGLYGVEDVEEPPEDAGAQVDRAAELQEIWQVQRGDLWRIGDHLLLCGDSTVREDVERVMDGERALLCVTDPPYGVNLDQGWRDRIGLNGLGRAQGDSINLDDGFEWATFLDCFGGDIVYLWHAGRHAIESYQALLDRGFDIRQQIIWLKTMAPLSRAAYHWKHEPCWYAVRNGSTASWYGGRDQTTVWEAASPKHIMAGSDEVKQYHPTQKPSELMARPIRNHTQNGEAVYDPFGGSGTTMVAAEQLGRQCRMIEIEPKYCAVILQRMSDLGLKPERV